VLRLNAEHRPLLSNDLGAMAGFLFDVSNRYPLPLADDHISARAAWETDMTNVREEATAIFSKQQMVA
jgi:type II restriction enzyme